MSIRTKAIVVVVAWPLLGFPLVVATAALSSWFLLILVPLFIALGVLSLTLKCPNCRWPVLNRKVHVAGFEPVFATPFAPRRCTNCGWDLGQGQNSSSEPRS